MAVAYRKSLYFTEVEQVIAAIRNGEPIYWGDKLRTHKSMLDTTLRMLIVATAMRQLAAAIKED
jgi:hypothetical protein